MQGGDLKFIMKSTAVAHPNVAFIKYWGRKSETLRLPTNGSFSINLSGLTTKTTVEFSEQYTEDSIIIDRENQFEEAERVVKHLDRVRALANIKLKAKVMSENSFPSGTGLSSSASGFAALTVAAVSAAGIKLSEKELSILARQGSGSACRSIPGGFVEWKDADYSEESYAYSAFPSDHWDIADVVAVVSTEKKDVPTSEGQKLAQTSPFFEARAVRMADKLSQIKKIIEKKNFTEFGELIEAEALEMHAIMITSNPSLIYWSVGTLKIMKLVKKWRLEGLPVYFTINTGQDIHLICEKKNSTIVESKLKKVPDVKKILVSSPAEGAYSVSDNLF